MGATTDPSMWALPRSDPRRPFRWTPRRVRAAVMIADGTLTHAEIARQIGVTPASLDFWKQAPVFKERIAELREQMQAAIMETGIAVKANRILSYDDDLQRLQMIIDERAADPTMQHIPGARSGYLVRRYKALGSGDSMEIREEVAFEAELSRERRELRKQAATEMGQWTEKKDVTSGGQRLKGYVVVSPDDWDNAAGDGDESS